MTASNYRLFLLICAFVGLYFCFSSKSNQNPVTIDIIITKRRSLPELHRCVNSIMKSKSDEHLIHQRVILIQEERPKASLKLFEDYLCAYQADDFMCPKYIDTLDQNYTGILKHAIDIGARGKNNRPVSSHIVVLHSDTIVTEGWLIQLYSALTTSNNARLVGPISNLARYQSVPYIDKNISSNYMNYTLPPGLDLEHTAKAIRQFLSQNHVNNIPVTYLDPFCFMFPRSLLKERNVLNIKRYGEETEFIADLLMNVKKRKYQSFVVPTSFVYHNNIKLSTVADGHAQNLIIEPLAYKYQKMLKPVSKKEKRTAFSTEQLLDFEQQDFHRLQALNDLRKNLSSVYTFYSQHFPHARECGSILFVLHDIAVAGGIISILQESLQIMRYGVNISLALPKEKGYAYASTVISSIIPNINEQELENIIKLYSGSVLHPNPLSDSFINLAKQYDILIATHSLTAESVGTVTRMYPHIMSAYYVQDYEPWFFMNPFDPVKTLQGMSVSHYIYARNSYTVNEKSIFMFAKTKWTREMVQKHHKVAVHKVIPSLDHDMYYPDRTNFNDKFRKTWNSSLSSSGNRKLNLNSQSEEDKKKFQIMAMIRPRTARRNPLNTLELLLKLAYHHKDRVKVVIFGCEINSLRNALTALQKLKGHNPYRKGRTLFKQKNVEFLGIMMDRKQIADKYRQSDIFIDLSWWQAFGRSALEAMACGCVAVMPLTGAAAEMCHEGRNCLYHDGNDVDGYYKKILDVLQNDEYRYSLIKRGLKKTLHFTIEAAAASIANELQKGLVQHREAILRGKGLRSVETNNYMKTTAGVVKAGNGSSYFSSYYFNSSILYS